MKWSIPTGKVNDYNMPEYRQVEVSDLSKLEKAMYGLTEVEHWIKAAHDKAHIAISTSNARLSHLPKVTFSNKGLK